MNVQELREALAEMPGHLPVHVAVKGTGFDGWSDTDYLYTLDVQRDNFPTKGSMAVIRIDYGGATTDEEAQAFIRAMRKHPEPDGDGVSGNSHQCISPKDVDGCIPPSHREGSEDA
jgi:hypothetical protein